VVENPLKDLGLVEAGFAMILQGLGLNWRRDPHLKDTPKRAAEAWYNEIFGGLTSGREPLVKLFPIETDSGMVILRRIPVRSVCAHHLLPFVGHATVGYVSGNQQILGLSKLSRITDYYCRRPQVQEELTRQVAEDVWKRVGWSAEVGSVEMLRCMEQGFPGSRGGVGVVIKANHMCMQLRGVGHEGEMVTSHLLGEFRETAVRAEFLNLAGVMR
jgi:GTP cyclohydrolase I